MRQFLPLLLLAAPLMAMDAQPQPVPPPVQPLPHGQPVQVPPGIPRADAMKELREVEGQWRALRDKAAQDPEVVAAKKAVEDAQKAYRAKEEEVMAKDPSFVDLKAKREATRAKLQRPQVTPGVKPEGAPSPAPADVPVPALAPVPAPAPAPAP